MRGITKRTDFRTLSFAYALITFASFAPLVVLIPFIIDRGFSSGFAALIAPLAATAAVALAGATATLWLLAGVAILAALVVAPIGEHHYIEDHRCYCGAGETPNVERA